MSAAPEVLEQRLVIAVDYGTTYTGVAYATTTTGNAILDEIDIVQDWGKGMANDDKVPSVIAYSLGKERNWGSNLSPQAIAMVHTKLQLDVSDTTAELDLILQALDGMDNLRFGYVKGASGTRKYTNKAPEQIVEDYLTEVLEYVLKAVENWTESYRRVTPVDIVATIPATWTYGAKNSLFRALNRAGFNRDNFKKLEQMLLLSEPEAAAIYTARYLKEKCPESVPLKKNECFVLCDAGGGTVDVVSYQVKQLQPTLEIEIVSIPTSFKCGSTFINLAFKEWLYSLIGGSNFGQLNPTPVAHKIWSHDAEGEPMRQLMNAFDLKKKLFTRENRRDILMTLPSPLNNLKIPNKVHDGQIKIKFEDMQSFFEPCVSRIVDLIHDQVEETENKKKRRVKKVFLVGGFASSKYLQESLNDSLEERHLRSQTLDTSWTAVVRGAAVFGIEKALNKITSMDASTEFYGISVNKPFSRVANHDIDRVRDPLTDTEMAKDQLIWMIKRGDLILSTRPKEVRGTFTIHFSESEVKTGGIPIYSFDDEEDSLPISLHNRQNDLTTLGVLEYDLRNTPEHILYRRAFGPNPAFFVAPFTIIMRLTVTSLHVELHLNNQLLCEKAFDLPTRNDEERN